VARCLQRDPVWHGICRVGAGATLTLPVSDSAILRRRDLLAAVGVAMLAVPASAEAGAPAMVRPSSPERLAIRARVEEGRRRIHLSREEARRRAAIPAVEGRGAMLGDHLGEAFAAIGAVDAVATLAPEEQAAPEVQDLLHDAAMMMATAVLGIRPTLEEVARLPADVRLDAALDGAEAQVLTLIPAARGRRRMRRGAARLRERLAAGSAAEVARELLTRIAGLEARVEAMLDSEGRPSEMSALRNLGTLLLGLGVTAGAVLTIWGVMVAIECWCTGALIILLGVTVFWALAGPGWALIARANRIERGTGALWTGSILDDGQWHATDLTLEATVRYRIDAAGIDPVTGELATWSPVGDPLADAGPASPYPFAPLGAVVARVGEERWVVGERLALSGCAGALELAVAAPSAMKVFGRCFRVIVRGR